jgi:hypothetical protein
MLTKSGTKLMDFGLAKESCPVPLAAALTEMTAEQSKLTDLHLTGSRGDHFQCQIDEKGEILSQEDVSPGLSLLLAYLPLRITLVDSEGEGLEITIQPRAERAA